MISVKKIANPDELETVFDIRQKVFVEEQNVPREEEYDEFEETAAHYLATFNGRPAGVARWRETDKGVKLERFAVFMIMIYEGRKDFVYLRDFGGFTLNFNLVSPGNNLAARKSGGKLLYILILNS